MTIVLLAAVLAVAAPVSKSQQAERMASTARAHPKDASALAEARQALALTEDFDPTAFVKPGRKGEVVEDEYRAALAEYRRHRARLYEAMGACLDARGESRAAVRYLRRALVLDPPGADVAALGRALLHDNRPREALDVLLSHASGPIAGERLAAAGEAADLAGIPSLQAELDRARLLALDMPRPEPRDGPMRFAERLRLSTGAPLHLDDDIVSTIYVAAGACRSCSQDLAELKRVLPAEVRALVAAAEPEDDRTLRQALELYHVTWPVVLGTRAGAYGPKAPVVWVIGRGGWSAAVLEPPIARSLPAVLGVFARQDVSEPRPRAKWNGRPAERQQLAAQPPLAADGLVPGEDEPAPSEFAAASDAFRAGRAREALAMVETLHGRADGWLLSPEARLDRALCLARQGEVATARRLLRSIGDSRFQERVDTALESLPR
jgi:tetratricopeptide (TPR) repeat protein